MRHAVYARTFRTVGIAAARPERLQPLDADSVSLAVRLRGAGSPGIGAADALATVVTLFAFIQLAVAAEPRLQAAGEGIAYAANHLVDGDCAAVVRITDATARERCGAECDVHHGDEIVHGDGVVAVAVADAISGELCWRGGGADDEETERQRPPQCATQ